MYTQHNNFARPFTPTTYASFAPQAVDMQNRRKASVGGKSNYENINFDGWSAEGYAIGITKYDGIVENEKLPQSYIDENLIVAEERIVLAGYRLAYLMKYIYPATNATGFLQ